jgi:hypothetical protein
MLIYAFIQMSVYSFVWNYEIFNLFFSVHINRKIIQDVQFKNAAPKQPHTMAQKLNQKQFHAML